MNVDITPPTTGQKKDQEPTEHEPSKKLPTEFMSSPFIAL